MVKSDGISDSFLLSSGVLQGDTLAPYLFILVMDYIMRFSLSKDLALDLLLLLLLIFFLQMILRFSVGVFQIYNLC